MEEKKEDLMTLSKNKLIQRWRIDARIKFKGYPKPQKRLYVGKEKEKIKWNRRSTHRLQDL